MDLAGYYNYWVAIVLMMIGFYGVIASGNLVKKLIALGVFQAAVFLLYISMGLVKGATSPVLSNEAIYTLLQGGEDPTLYSNPLPHVLILTAIVVGVATLSLGLALVVRIKEEYGCIEEDDILLLDEKEDDVTLKSVTENREAS